MSVDIHKLIDAVVRVVQDGNWNPIMEKLAHNHPTVFVNVSDETNPKYQVVMENDNGIKIPAIKLVRHLTSMGLKEAKDFVESLPHVVYFKPRQETMITNIHGDTISADDLVCVQRYVEGYSTIGGIIPWECFRIEKV